jgi:myo-inositol-1(or 4)-monophosphatase
MLTQRWVSDSFQSITSDLAKWLDSVSFESSLSSQVKPDGSLITSIDLLIQDYIREITLKYLPDCLVISEEDLDLQAGLPARIVLLIDPLDGTENFASSIPIWGTGLALFVEGQLTHSSCLFPEIQFAHCSSGITNPPGYRVLRRTESDRSLILYPANFFAPDLSNVAIGSNQRILGCSLFNIAVASISGWTFTSSGPGLKAWDFLPVILPAIQSGHSVLVNNKTYDLNYLSPLERYHVTLLKGIS